LAVDESSLMNCVFMSPSQTENALRQLAGLTIA
jgi:hypothetical protein